VRELIAAKEAAAALAPDDPNVVGIGLYQYWGRYVGLPDWEERAQASVDSAISLDSGWANSLRFRLELALFRRDTADIRHVARAYFAADSAGDFRGDYGLGVAIGLGDTAALDSIIAKYHEFSEQSVLFLPGVFMGQGIPLELAARVTARWEEGQPPTASPLGRRPWERAEIAIGRGRVAHWLALTDSIRLEWSWDIWVGLWVITQALAEPGFDSAAAVAWRRLDQLADSTDDPDALCYAQIWRVAQKDTTNARRTIERFWHLIRGEWETNPLRFAVGELGVCPLLLDAMVEWTGQVPETSPALERLDSLMRLGPLEAPYDLANLWLARSYVLQGNIDKAYAAIRRQPAANFLVHLRPAYFREEGRLAAMTGDTAAAIKAYERYLTVRDDPDPVLQPVVDSVRAELAALVGRERQ
jgi:hypothetical protein